MNWANLCVLPHVLNMLGPPNSVKSVCRKWRAVMPIYSHINISGEYTVDKFESLLESIDCSRVEKINFWEYYYPVDFLSVKRMMNLKVIVFNRKTRINNDMMNFLSDFKSLREIEFGEGRIDAKCIGILARCRQISKLDFWSCEVSDGIVQMLCQFKKLEEINLYDCGNVMDEDIGALVKLVKLRKLCLRGCDALTDRTMVYVASLGNMEELDVSECVKITDDGIDRLVVLKKLRVLRVRECPLITCVSMSKLRVVELNMSYSVNVTNDDLRMIGGNNMLRKLVMMMNVLIDCRGLIYLSFLRELDLSLCDQLVDNDIRGMNSFCFLNNLKLKECVKLTNKCLGFLVGLPLVTLNLSRCDKITCRGIGEVMRDCGTLYKLSIGGKGYRWVGNNRIGFLSSLKNVRILNFDIDNRPPRRDVVELMWAVGRELVIGDCYF